MAIKFYSLEGLYREYICVLSLLFQRTLNEKILVRENCTFSSANKNLIIIYLFEENFPSLFCKSNKCVYFIFENIQRGYLFLHLLHKPQNQYQAVRYFLLNKEWKIDGQKPQIIYCMLGVTIHCIYFSGNSVSIRLQFCL